MRDFAMTARPIDVLNQAKGKRVLVKLKNGTEISGVLQAMDLHLNMWLDDAEQITKENKIKLGTVLVRGDNVLYVSPAEQ